MENRRIDAKTIDGKDVAYEGWDSVLKFEEGLRLFRRFH